MGVSKVTAERGWLSWESLLSPTASCLGRPASSAEHCSPQVDLGTPQIPHEQAPWPHRGFGLGLKAES